MSRRIAMVFVALVLAPAVAHADDSLRPLCPDRPGKGTSPCTLDEGHFQIEIDAFDDTFQRSGGVTIDTTVAADPTLKYGLTDDFDIEASIAPYISMRTHDSATGTTQTVSGIGDLYLRAKWIFPSGSGGPLAAVIEPFVKIPTAAHGLGDGAVEGGVVLPLSYDLGGNWSLAMTPETDFLKNAIGDGRHVTFVDVVGLGRAFDNGVTLGAEVWTSQDFDPSGTTRQYSFDLDAAWQPDPDIQLDGGVNIGLNAATPDVQIYAGISRRF
jgi:hypothetical protein